MTYLIQYRKKAGRTRRLALGKAAGARAFSLLSRPVHCKDRVGRVAKGEDPSAARRADRKGLTVADLCDNYLTAAEKGIVVGKRRRPRSPLRNS
jgi:hypothetical protein